MRRQTKRLLTEWYKILEALLTTESLGHEMSGSGCFAMFGIIYFLIESVLSASSLSDKGWGMKHVKSSEKINVLDLNPMGYMSDTKPACWKKMEV